MLKCRSDLVLLRHHVGQQRIEGGAQIFVRDRRLGSGFGESQKGCLIDIGLAPASKGTLCPLLSTLRSGDQLLVDRKPSIFGETNKHCVEVIVIDRKSTRLNSS